MPTLPGTMQLASSLDIEGAELKALQGLPFFDRYTFGALDIEHNDEEPKRFNIQILLKSRRPRAVLHSWLQDDFYASIGP